MPELPEVEVLVRYLAPRVSGRRILSTDVHRPRVLRPTTAAALAAALNGAVFRTIQRRAKYLVFSLGRPASGDFQLVGHLGMTGRMYLLGRVEALPKHAAVVMELVGGDRFVFEDTRCFGRLTLDASGLEGLGPEPLSDTWQPGDLRSALAGSTQAVKVRLLDQCVVAGVGNIYASEALFRAGVSPRRRSNRVTAAECTRLHAGIREVLGEAIEAGSTIPLDFAGGTDGLFYYGSETAAPGRHEERILVYDRAGQPCVRCGKPIRRGVQAQRSTYWCPGCQR